MDLRWYQSESVAAAWAAIRRNEHPCVVLPTGAGKSIVIAELARQAVSKWQGRVICLAHRKELLTQNADKLAKLLPGIEIGIYSAGLNRRDWWQDVVCAGIQSVYRRAEQFERRHLIIVDEAHLLPESDSGMYRKFLRDIEAINPQVRVVGLTATPFRMDCGCITDGGILTSICYEASVADLMRQGFLARITNTATHQVDVSRVKTVNGEFAAQQLEETFLAEVDQNTREAIRLAEGRQSVLWFCAGVAHANRTADAVAALTGERVGVVTGDTLPIERQSLLADFAARRLRHLVNCDVLTTGFDAPCIDCIVVLRATKSAGLFAQICGRGFRLYNDKPDCLVLDFGGNIGRHGPLDDPQYGRRKRAEREASDEAPITVPTKQCPACGEAIPISVVFCPACGHMMPREAKTLDEEADTWSVILQEEIQPETVYVESVTMSRHRPRDVRKLDTLRVEYSCVREGGGNLAQLVVPEWVCLEHEGFAQRKAFDWWQQHTLALFADITEAQSLYRRGAMRMPVRLTIRKEGPFWKIVSREFEDERPESWAETEDEVFSGTDEEFF